MYSMWLAFAVSAAGILPTAGASSCVCRNSQESRRLHSARIIPRWFGHSQLLRRTHRLWNCAIADYDFYLLADNSDIHHLALGDHRSEEHTSELQSLRHLVCRLLLEKKKLTLIYIE